MRLLIVNESLNLGGAETMAVELANGLTEYPDVTIFFASPEGPLKERLLPQIRYCSFQPYSFPWIFKTLVALMKIIKEVKPDIIHSQGATIGILAGLAGRHVDPRIKLIMTHHSRNYTRVPTNVATFLIKKYADLSIAISRAKLQALVDSGLPQGSIAAIPNFVDIDRMRMAVNGVNRENLCIMLGIPHDSKIISMTGRMTPEKRFDRFIEILADVAKKTDKMIVGLVMGDGNERKKLEVLAQSLKHSNLSIRFLGYQKNVFQYLAISDLFLFPSEHREVLPMSLIEAQMLGIPSVCSNIPGNDEIVEDGKTGFLVNRSIADYSEKVLAVLGDLNLSIQMANNARERSTVLFEKKKVVSRILGVYQGLYRCC